MCSSDLSSLVDSLQGLPTRPPSIYIDLEGEGLSRDGSISILQIYVLPTERTYLIDVHTLRHEAFISCGPSGHTLKGMLESQDIPKVFFDVRNDSDALHNLFNIRLANISWTLQLEPSQGGMSMASANALNVTALSLSPRELIGKHVRRRV